MADHVVQCGACRVDVQVVREGDGFAARCPACARTAPRDEAIRVARSSLIDVVMRDLDENLREIVRASPIVGYQPAQRYDWVLKGVGG
ncbi:hypothetical protein [Caulobacter sp. FWC2]|jgi:hypothetical protein|uniref:hypothetical protein n=1 Tax=Caulobacter sp. FWC2 TaxID=69664 RepID=UPI000C15AD61|nr:hypothetical protein [Caulobacter sp. FWC2]PIB94357.1 hypothetical protein CSW62_23980 [Caulobacter sp. FWC2]